MRPNLGLLFFREVLCPQVFVLAIETHRGEMRISIIVLRLSTLEIRHVYYLFAYELLTARQFLPCRQAIAVCFLPQPP